MITVAKYISKYLEKKKLKNIPIFQGGAIMNTINEIGKKIKVNQIPKKIKGNPNKHMGNSSTLIEKQSKLHG